MTIIIATLILEIFSELATKYPALKQKKSNMNYFNKIGTDLMNNIFTWIDYNTKLIAKLTCKTFNASFENTFFHNFVFDFQLLRRYYDANSLYVPFYSTQNWHNLTINKSKKTKNL